VEAEAEPAPQAAQGRQERQPLSPLPLGELLSSKRLKQAPKRGQPPAGKENAEPPAGPAGAAAGKKQRQRSPGLKARTAGARPAGATRQLRPRQLR